MFDRSKRTRTASLLVALVDAVALAVAHRVRSDALAVVAPGGWKVPVFRFKKVKFKRLLFNRQSSCG